MCDFVLGKLYGCEWERNFYGGFEWELERVLLGNSLTVFGRSAIDFNISFRAVESRIRT